MSSSGTSSQHPLHQGVTQPVHVNHVTGIDHQLANANRKNQAAEKVKSLGSASGTGLRPGSTSVTAHNPNVNLSDRPQPGVTPHKTASSKDVLAQKPVIYSGWSKQSVAHVATPTPSHQTKSKLPTTHSATSAKHTTSNVLPVRKNKVGDGQSGQIATGPKHLTTSHSPHHTDLQNEATILSHKYPSVASQNIDQHLATVKANSWGSNGKKSTDTSKVSTNTVNRVNVSSSAQGSSLTTTPMQSGSKVASTKPTVNPHPTTTLTKTGTMTSSTHSTTAPQKGWGNTKFYKSDSLGFDLLGGGGVLGGVENTLAPVVTPVMNTIAPVVNTIAPVVNTVTSGVGKVSSSVAGGITMVGSTLSPSPQALQAVFFGELAPTTVFFGGLAPAEV